MARANREVGVDSATDALQDAYRDEAATALALNPANPYAMDSVGYLDVLAGDFERGRSLLERSLSVNPFHPSFFHDGCFVEHYRREDYQGALDAVAVDREKNFWISDSKGRQPLAAARSTRMNK